MVRREPTVSPPIQTTKNEQIFYNEQTPCRIPKQIFLPHEVFNTCVDKLVENGGVSQANYTVLSTLKRFALFECSCQVSKENADVSNAKLASSRTFLRRIGKEMTLLAKISSTGKLLHCYVGAWY
jgi:hypothetical protein